MEPWISKFLRRAVVGREYSKYISNGGVGTGFISEGMASYLNLLGFFVAPGSSIGSGANVPYGLYQASGVGTALGAETSVTYGMCQAVGLGSPIGTESSATYGLYQAVGIGAPIGASEALNYTKTVAVGITSGTGAGERAVVSASGTAAVPVTGYGTEINKVDASGRVEVNPTWLPKFTVSVSPNAFSTCAGEKVLFTVTVKNVGGIPGSYKLTVTLGSNTVYTATGSLDPGGRRDHFVWVTAPSSQGTYELKATVYNLTTNKTDGSATAYLVVAC
jgi:hypothetical protein